jgi:hypothetical protein
MSQTISGYNLTELISRFPDFEPSYETISHKNVPKTYNIAFAIPTGKKVYLWYTFYNGQNALFLIDMNKNGRVLKCSKLKHSFVPTLAYSTLLYGVYLQETDAFLIEDIYYYKGLNLKGLTTGAKLIYIKDLLTNDITNSTDNMTISLPVFWYNNETEINVHDLKIPEDIKFDIPYNIHHVQYRILNEIVPFINISINRRPIMEKKKLTIKDKDNITYNKCKYTHDYNKIKNGTRAIFIIKADLQADIYRMYAEENKTKVYYNTACIPNYNTSVYMNKHFRNIKENNNIDYIEESEDEEDFQNINVDRFVDLNKELLFECEYKRKFKRWVPKRIIRDKNMHIIHISKLVKYNTR